MLRVWVEDRLVPAEEAVVSAYDRGFRSGEGVFETLRAYGEHVFRLSEHLERARAGARELGFDPGPTAHLAEAVRTTAAANLEELGGEDSAVRLTVSAGRVDPHSPIPGHPVGAPTLVVTSHPLAPAPTGMTAAAVPLARELPHVKAVSYLIAVMARRQARALGADEALLLDGDGRILEGASTNVFAVLGDELVTPPADAGLLAGVTRAVVLERARAEGLALAERRFDVQELLGAREAFLTSTTRELVPLTAVDRLPLGTGRAGPVTRHLQEAYAVEVARERREAAAEGP